MHDIHRLVPKIDGLEKYEIGPSGAVAISGTGFDECNPQHMLGSDAVRYAIAIQQLRDQGRYSEADEARDAVRSSYVVSCGRDTTQVGPLSFKAVPMSVVNGVLYDT